MRHAHHPSGRPFRLGPVLALAVATGLVAPLSAGPGLVPGARAAERAAPATAAAATEAPRPLLVNDLRAKLLAKAQPDECFNGVGEPYPPGPPCDEGIPKVNQVYLWGLTKVGSVLWLGTGANVHCLFGGTFGAISGPELNEDFVCERGQSQFAQDPDVPPRVGDFRIPEIFAYDTASGTLTDKTPLQDKNFQPTVGIRAAGALDNVVLLAGPALAEERGINVMAFRADSGDYLGSARLAEYDNIRKFLVVDGVLYTGVINHGAKGGSVLRWRGSVKAPFAFEVVASLDNEVAELGEHDGRLFAATWPVLTETGGRCPDSGCPLAGLWMSPKLPRGGLTAAQADRWQQVWRVDDYEPDEITARAYGVGALQSFGGYLHWGTLHFPGLASRAHHDQYGRASVADEVRLRQRVERAISIFRGRSFSTTPEIQLLYGETSLPAFTPGQGWQNEPTGQGPPLYGPSGFGNSRNRYTWTMAVFRDDLYVGTFDLTGADREGRGADLWRFRSTTEAAQAVSLDGIGNYFNRGIRTMLADDRLYLGTANPANLRTDPDDAVPEGGWELLEVRRR